MIYRVTRHQGGFLGVLDKTPVLRALITLRPAFVLPLGFLLKML